jgi:glucose/arabinose dehydrogenase
VRFILLLLYLLPACLTVGLVCEILFPSPNSLLFAQPAPIDPTLRDRNFTAVPIVTGLGFPTKMSFIGPDDLLVLEKNTMEIKRFKNNTISNTYQLLSNKIWNETVGGERGLLGIEVSSNEGYDDLFVYFTEKTYNTQGERTVSNRLYKYELHNDTITNPKLLLSIPNPVGRIHNGGALLEGPDKFLYLTVGDMGRRTTLAQNIQDGKPPDGTSGIHRLSKNGMPGGAFGNLSGTFMDSYFAYGIRNSFGITFDPVTGHLWDIENGPTFGDEINLVPPGFNSGWNPVNMTNFSAPKDLVSLNGVGNYSSPKLTWEQGNCLSATIFLSSDKYGIEYTNDLFVANIIDGKLYNFDLTKNRTSLELNGPLSDQIVNAEEELDREGRVFGEGFGTIADIKVGPDGYLYVLTGSGSDTVYRPYQEGHLTNYNGGTLYKIIPTDIYQ